MGADEVGLALPYFFLWQPVFRFLGIQNYNWYDSAFWEDYIPLKTAVKINSFYPCMCNDCSHWWTTFYYSVASPFLDFKFPSSVWFKKETRVTSSGCQFSV